MENYETAANHFKLKLAIDNYLYFDKRQTLTIPSTLPLATDSPSGLNDASQSLSACSVKVR